MAILEISVLPIGTDKASIGSFVTESCKIIKDKGLPFEVTPTSTVVEGDLKDLIELAEEMHVSPFKIGAKRVVTNITIDQRTDKEDDMEDKVEEVIKNI